MEERTRQMKLKMNKYKPGAGSDSRLEQDYHKVPHTPPPTAAANIYLRCAVCAVVLDHMVQLCEQPCVYARSHFNNTLCKYADHANKNIPEQKTLQTTFPK